MDIDIKTNLDEFVAHLSDLEKKQLPFATSRALNDVAKDMQAKVIDATTSHFNNTKQWYLPGRPLGIKRIFSDKRDLTSGVFTKAPFGILQEEGGVKTATKTANLAIPLDDIQKKYKTNRPGLSGAKRALQETGKRKPFIIMANGKLGMYQRTTKKRFPLKLLFRLQPSARTEKRWGFKDAAEGEARRRFVSAFQKRLIEAIESMKQ
jgi:hypothetical protein